MLSDVTPSKRSKARRLALQALYQWQISAAGIAEIKAQFYTFNDMAKLDEDYFNELLGKITANASAIDELYAQYCDRSLDELNPIELAVLRIGCYELAHRLDIPYKVVIDEALRLTKSFGSTEGHKYVNAILDKAAAELRQAEKQA